MKPVSGLPRLIVTGVLGLGAIWAGVIARIIILRPQIEPLAVFSLPIPPQATPDESYSSMGAYHRWRWKDGHRELLYSVVMGHFVSCSRSSNPSSIIRLPIGMYDITEYPDRLVINNREMLVTAKTRIFVLRRDGTIMRVTMTDEELSGFTIDFAKHSLHGSALWKEKIEPLLVPAPPDREPEGTALAH